MKGLKPFALAACLALGIAPGRGLAEPGGGKDPAKPKPFCHDVAAAFTSELVTAEQGCPSPLGCASGRIRHDALLKGNMFVTLTDGAPHAGMPASQPYPMFSVSGVRELMPRRGGSLRAQVVGVFDQTPQSPSLFHFVELNVIESGTGPFEGATGVLHVSGQPIGPTSFAGEITGRICLP